MNQKLVDVREIAKRIGVSRFIIYEWVREEKIPYLKTVGGLRFDPVEIDGWLKRHRQDHNFNKD